MSRFFSSTLAPRFCWGVALCFSANTAHLVRADAVPFVDHYKTNVSSNHTESSNAALVLLSGVEVLWTPGQTWDTGKPTEIGAKILSQNLEYVLNATTHRTTEQATAAYLDDRRNQTYSVTTGLGSLAAAYYASSGSFTTITNVPADATTKVYDDAGNGAGSTTSRLGKVVSLMNTLRGTFSSTVAAKNYLQYPRPFRQSLNGQSMSSVVLPTLVPAISKTPEIDGGFPSGHTNASYLTGFALAYAIPQRFDDLVFRASGIGQDRIIAGMHSALDVIGGRIEATALAAAILNDPDNASLKSAAYHQAQTVLAAELAADSPKTQSTYVANNKVYVQRLTYGFSPVADTTKPAIVPKGAEVLLETRFNYLTADQRREILRTTEIASGYAVENAEGWNRLNLYAASGGYGALDNTVTVNMDASLGGMAVKDIWRNDIAGTGGLIKSGSGTLVLAGDDTFRGGTEISGGELVVNGTLASKVTVHSGAALGGSGKLGGGLVLQKGAILDLNVGSTLTILGDALAEGGLVVKLSGTTEQSPKVYTLVDFSGANATNLSVHQFTLSPDDSKNYKLELNGKQLQLVPAQ